MKDQNLCLSARTVTKIQHEKGVWRMQEKKTKQLYHKMVRTCTLIVLFIVTSLTLYFISDSRSGQLEENRGALRGISDQALNYIEETGRTADYIHKDLYRSSQELEDLLAYFRLNVDAYQYYSLDQYIKSPDLVYKSSFRFFNETFEAYSQLEKIELISYQNLRLTECRPGEIVYPGGDGRARMKQVQADNYCEKGKLVFLKEIRHPDTLKPMGCMLFTFHAQKELEAVCAASPHANMVVLYGAGSVIFESPKNSNYQRQIWDKHAYVCTESARGHLVYTFLDERKASRIPAARLALFLTVGTTVGAAGILYIRYFVARLTGRVDLILSTMNQVTTGDFKVRLPVGKKNDELERIAENFNEMCEKLEMYIEKSYLEEIERKNAQMQALQSQINPHFLYNTLEAIRMKAICNGDREVGKMLYSMVVLFRSQLKEADVITLGQELDYCKQYMELFEYRYQDCFHSSVECAPELLNLSIIKFVLQPVLENYFIHGIERDRKDNRVTIRAERKGDVLFLHVQDNGCGMDEGLLREKNRELEENQKNLQNQKSQKSKGKAESVGIQNINRRIKAVYGEQYGIHLKKAEPKGLTVTLSVKAEAFQREETE